MALPFGTAGHPGPWISQRPPIQPQNCQNGKLIAPQAVPSAEPVFTIAKWHRATVGSSHHAGQKLSNGWYIRMAKHKPKSTPLVLSVTIQKDINMSTSRSSFSKKDKWNKGASRRRYRHYTDPARAAQFLPQLLRPGPRTQTLPILPPSRMHLAKPSFKISSKNQPKGQQPNGRSCAAEPARMNQPHSPKPASIQFGA
ncbi:unnamed protein product [Prunus armeniaca]|uniref:Uncharacterized protein n=1 Tax=Prunus armeniaca TaxID=36596 RepID=A0A6J5WEA7_PRUAR|nr:unnamed protein product [Prunus armeniaca]CAB4298683.1 unnamed protein product [Prunus armeniaca]